MLETETTPRRVRTDDGLDLAVHERGPEGAPTVVFVHGFPDDHTVWDGVARILAHRYRVVAYDTRGSGASPGPIERAGYRLERLAADLRAVIDATAAGRAAHIVGHDWGSIQSWEAVTDDRMRSRIASFTSISGPCLDHAARWMRRGGPGVLRQLAKSYYIGVFHVPGATELIWDRWLAEAWPRLLLRDEGIRDAVSPDAGAVARGLEIYRANIFPTMASPRRRSTSVPVQVIAPKDDRYVSPPLVRSAEPWVDDLFVREVAGGHWVVRTHPERAAEWIEDLVADVEGTRAAPWRSAAPLR
jgi:pimeloyl-ACP methyl ester carboxylesterase